MGVSLAAGLGEVGCDGLALRLKAKPGSALAIGADAKVGDEPPGLPHGHAGVFATRSVGAIIHPKD